jgi:hypothetical protein
VAAWRHVSLWRALAHWATRACGFASFAGLGRSLGAAGAQRLPNVSWRGLLVVQRRAPPYNSDAAAFNHYNAGLVLHGENPTADARF